MLDVAFHGLENQTSTNENFSMVTLEKKKKKKNLIGLVLSLNHFQELSSVFVFSPLKC